MKTKEIILTGLSFLLIFGTLSGFCLFNREAFNGSFIKSSDRYSLDIEQMNTDDFHTMKLHSGDRLKIHFEESKGSLTLIITSEYGSEVYRGKGKEVTDFTINIEKSGNYTVAVEGRRAKGKVDIILIKNKIGE